jgi:hypothetical protein
MMECDVFKRRICEDPSVTDPDFRDHEESCKRCAAFAQRVRSTESLIRDALRFDVAGARESAARHSARVAQETRAVRWASMAAAFVAAAGIWLMLEARYPLSTEELAAEVLQHWDHEPYSWTVNDAVPHSRLHRVLGGKATIDLTSIGTISYARVCRVAGQWMPHLVLQTADGPVMILLVPEQQVAERVPLRLPEEGLGGMLRPLGNGSIAIIGDDSRSLVPVEESLAAAIDLTI